MINLVIGLIIAIIVFAIEGKFFYSLLTAKAQPAEVMPARNRLEGVPLGTREGTYVSERLETPRYESATEMRSDRIGIVFLIALVTLCLLLAAFAYV